MKELDLGNDVVVSSHSYGGILTNSALDGLSRSERERDGKTTAVSKIAWVTSFILLVGVDLQTAIGGRADNWIISDANEIMIEKKDFLSMLYHDLDLEDAKYWLSNLRPHSFPTFLEGPRSAAYKMIPSAYLVCEDDRAIPKEGQDVHT
ncbi:hypothetical protein G7Y89_g7264 [Cudoniella acicularis]|uniref:AB hydrolase-1 domain-containing protein n=1 Tax=Cudoniella acicularis TaxID=354080 RepID=A0A8H4RIX7_9HELO|nr:hypothetical protein G7Y89_g7264 [Cudoniella acicularis]